ncbi:MAG: aminopeptidase P family protein [Lachnospiraceae bacterium]|nr:aminopeptidase P family protein [Lachnospiraceae bacterium]
MFQERRKQLQYHIEKAGMQAVIIDSPSNLYYYTGFTGGEGMFFLPIEKSVGYLITDSRYYEQVEKECPEITLIRMENRGFSELVKELVNDCFSDITESMLSIAVESTMNLQQYLKLCEVCKECSFLLSQDSIMESRMIKDEVELSKIAKAEAIGDAAFTHILPFIKPGVSEQDISLELEFYMKRQGASKLSFDTIVASGPNSSMPHAQVTNRKLQLGDFITMDFGCVYEGYCSDMTRTVALGEPTEEMRKVYQIVLDANLRAMDGIREGVHCNQVDALARDYIADKGYGDYFGHGLGHGVGLDIHEEPRFSKKCEVIAKENMVITNEPGIYLPGRFGVRIEDLVVVKKNGCEILSRSDKSLMIL